MRNVAAGLVCSSRKYDRVTPVLQQLHWLEMEQRIEYTTSWLYLSTAAFTVCRHRTLRTSFKDSSALDSRRRLRYAVTYVPTPSSFRRPVSLSLCLSVSLSLSLSLGDRLSPSPQLGRGTVCHQLSHLHSLLKCLDNPSKLNFFPHFHVIL